MINSRHTCLLALGLLVLAACQSTHPRTETPPPHDYSSAELDLSSPTATAHSMMLAMYRGDSQMVDSVFIEGGTLQRVKADGRVTGNSLPKWQDWVGTLETGQAHEDIFGLKVQEFENLATVWAPFVIEVDGKVAGCGVNHLAMVRDGHKWRVAVGMDTPAPIESCADFKARTLAAK